MTNNKRSGKGRRGSILITTTLALPVLIAPMVGLGIDATICYIVQAELSAAVDGAALGAGRLLSTNANPTDIAKEFINANFRQGQAGFWGATLPNPSTNPNVNVVLGTTKQVTVTATAQVPLLFMRLLHYDTATVSASATATRRDARIMFVIDRSGSMSNSDGAGSTVIQDLVQYAQAFTQQFTPGYDELGLVTFSTSAVVGYPTTPWPAPVTYNGGGGPDVCFNSTGQITDSYGNSITCNSGTNTMVQQIGLITAAGNTGMGDGMAVAYIELQKAHVRDLAAHGSDTKFNAVVLFTDGVPNDVTAYPNRFSNSVVAAASGCTYATDTSTPTHPIYGFFEAQGSSAGGGPPFVGLTGLYQLASLDGSHTSSYYMSWNGSAPSPPTNPAPTGCVNSGWSAPYSNLTAIPSYDKYGYSLGPNGAGYKVSSFVNASTSSIFNGTDFNVNTPYGSTTTAHNAYYYQWGLAAWDEVDQAAEAIRSDANYATRGDVAPMKVTIYTVGYTGNGGTDAGLLEKVANVPGCQFNGYSCYDNTQSGGLYVQAADKTQLANAFVTIASAILRLSH